MLISAEKIYPRGGNPLTFREHADRNTKESHRNSIPLRYRDGMGGIDLEQVKRDQRRARRDFVRAMIRGLNRLQRPH
jgi:hypothetical protein